MTQFRRFRNTDPPGLVEVWNDAFTGRGTVRLRNSSPLERYTLSKIFFDPDGLILAVDEGRCVGFVHAGFGSNADGSALDYSTGVTSMLAVHSSQRGRGVGTELLRRAEEYLRRCGAKRVFAGPQTPLSPFYFGLYGGSDLPGFLASDPGADPFFTRHGYHRVRTVKVLQRRLGLPVKLFDPRFVAHRQRFELCEDAASKLGTWWKYCQFNGAEPRLVSLLDRTTHSYAATATLWEMEGFSFRWNTPTVGVVDWFVRPDLRGQGVGKYLLAQLLRSAQESLLEIMEMQVPEDNGAALKLCKFAGFEQVDEGRLYERVGD